MGRRGPLDMLKDTCGALGGLRMMDRVPLQVAVISLSRREGHRGRILCVCVCVFVGCERVHVVCFSLCHKSENKLGCCNIDGLLSVCTSKVTALFQCARAFVCRVRVCVHAGLSLRQ